MEHVKWKNKTKFGTGVFNFHHFLRRKNIEGMDKIIKVIIDDWTLHLCTYAR